MWRFYGYYGGLNVVGNLYSYGMYTDDSSFQVIPVWQNKLQAIQYEDHLYTRTSHYSYEIVNNLLRIYPTPDDVSPEKFWFRFTIDDLDAFVAVVSEHPPFTLFSLRELPRLDSSHSFI